MASLITEVYVSVDGLEFTKIDLHKDEAINMKYTQKDLQDISKIFAPYSLNFTFPATPKNRRAFGFFGDTAVVKINTEKKYFCKIYSSGQLFQNGYLMISDLSYKNNRPIDFTGSFANNITNLKDRIGDDTLNDLGSYLIEWLPSKAHQLLQGTESFTIDGINYLYYVPLISNNRVWSYNRTDDFVNFDNIAYKETTSPSSNNQINSNELKPALSFKTIFNLIKKRYNLDVIMPLENRREYYDLFVWCNNSEIVTQQEKKLILKNNFGGFDFRNAKNFLDIPLPEKYQITSNTTNSSYLVERIRNENEWDNFFSFNVGFDNLITTTTTENNPSVVVRLKKVSNNETFALKSFDLNSTTICTINVEDSLLVDDKIEFYATFQFSHPTLWSNMRVEIAFNYYDGKFGTFNSKRYATFFKYSNNNNSNDILANNLDLIKTLPNTKVIDFLNSFIKAFNISIYDTSPNDNKLYFLTPSDIETNGLVYSKATLDYTPYVDISSHKKSVPSEYNYYNFKHVTSKYRSNVDFKNSNILNLEYGQIAYPILTNEEKKTRNLKEFKVETNFSIIPPVYVSGSNSIITSYGFNSDTPELLDTGESRYKPNYNELTVFYKHNSVSLIDYLGFQNIIGGAFFPDVIKQYFPSLPFDINGNSFAFSILKEFNVEYPINLFSKGYQSQIIRYLDLNVLSQEYTATLPASELYLNEATTIQDGGATPVGFRLQNDIIIGETKFSILDAQIDITTGKSKLTLLNY